MNQPVDTALEWLTAHSSPSVLDAMGPKYGIHTAKAFGTPMKEMKVLAKQLGTSHELADQLWETGWYEARTVGSLIDDPAAVTAEQMDRWAHQFDNWAICDTTCFNLFDRTAHAWPMVDTWADSADEFVKRAAFALLWSLALHDKSAPDELFIGGLALIEREAYDDRNFVTKAIAMSIRSIARRNAALNVAVAEMGRRLEPSPSRAARAIGRTALKEGRGGPQNRRV